MIALERSRRNNIDSSFFFPHVDDDDDEDEVNESREGWMNEWQPAEKEAAPYTDHEIDW